MGCVRPLHLPCQVHGKAQPALYRSKCRPLSYRPAREASIKNQLITNAFSIVPASSTRPICIKHDGHLPAKGIQLARSALRFHARCYSESPKAQLLRMNVFRAQILWNLGRCILRLPGKLWDFVTSKKSIIEEVEEGIEEVADYAKKTAIKVEKVARTVEEVADYVEEGADKVESIIEKIQRSQETMEGEVNQALKDMEKSKEKLDKASKKPKDNSTSTDTARFTDLSKFLTMTNFTFNCSHTTTSPLSSHLLAFSP
ncbi:hypothetical protein L7F22_059815 [Adiantum nelumboides]|nr:hypothetical protein [Adiantum nelumboides]